MCRNIISKEKTIENVLQSNGRHCLFMISCPRRIKTLCVCADVSVKCNMHNTNTMDITPDTYIAKIYPSPLSGDNIEPLYQFPFRLNEKIEINKEFPDGHTIMIFGDFDDCDVRQKLLVDITIHAIKVGV